MAPVRRPPRPAVPVGLAFLGGVALGPERAMPLGCALVLTALAARHLPWLGGRLRHARPGRLLAIAIALACGASLEHRDRRAYASAAAWLPEDGSPLESHVVGRLLEPAEREADGGRRLFLRARPEGAPGAPLLTLLLSVRTSDAAAGVARLDALEAGDRVRVWCRVRRPADRASLRALRARGLSGSGSVKGAWMIERIAEGPASLARGAGRIKRVARERLDRLLPGAPAARGLAGAILLGDRAGLAPDHEVLLRRAGVVHVVSISGLHVGLVACFVHAALRRLRASPWSRAALIGLLLFGFVLLVGPRSAPVRRAAIGAAVVLFARALGRDGEPMNGLTALAAGLVAAAPGSLHDPALQLTFLATAGLLAFARRFAARIDLPSAVAAALAVSVAAYLATAPTLAAHFGTLAPIGVATGALAVPLGAAILFAGYTGIVTEPVPLVGAAAGELLRLSCEALDALAARSARSSLGSVPAAPHAAWLAAYYVLLGLLSADLARASAAARTLLRGAFALALVVVHVGGPPPTGDGKLRAAVLDVGQGQAVALLGPDGRAVLVDSGGSADPRFDPGERLVVPFLVRHGHRRLEVLVLSHDHVDHVGGAPAVLRALDVGELWLGPGSLASAALGPVVELARERGVALVLAERGLARRRAGISLRVHAPGREDRGLASNDRSVVLQAGEAPARLLVPGDLGPAGERTLLESGATLRSEAIVLSHHGSRHGSSARLLERVRPEWAVASAGRGNPFGHPHPDALGRARRAGACVRRTDLHGLVLLVQDPLGWRVLRDLAYPEGCGDERGREQAEQEHRDEQAPGTEPRRLVDHGRMAVAHPEQHGEPDDVRRELAGRRLVDDHPQQPAQRSAREPAMRTSRHGVGRVSAVELADGEEVERGDEHADPSRTGERVHPDGCRAVHER
jgi:competence protein ComEC